MGLQINRILGPGSGRSDSPMPDTAYIAGNGVVTLTCDSTAYTVDTAQFTNPVVGIGGCSNVTTVSGFVGLYNSNTAHNGQPDTLTANKVLTFADSTYTAVAADDFVHGYGLIELSTSTDSVIIDLSKVKGYIPVDTGETIKVLSEGGLAISGQKQIASATDENHSITDILLPGDTHTVRAGGGQLISAEGKFQFNSGSNTPVVIDTQSSNLELPIILNSGQSIEVFGGHVAYYDTTS